MEHTKCFWNMIKGKYSEHQFSADANSLNIYSFQSSFVFNSLGSSLENERISSIKLLKLTAQKP